MLKIVALLNVLEIVIHFQGFFKLKVKRYIILLKKKSFITFINIFTVNLTHSCLKNPEDFFNKKISAVCIFKCTFIW